jgi:hypothetical protein
VTASAGAEPSSIIRNSTYNQRLKATINFVTNQDSSGQMAEFLIGSALKYLDFGLSSSLECEVLLTPQFSGRLDLLVARAEMEKPASGTSLLLFLLEAARLKNLSQIK